MLGPVAVSAMAERLANHFACNKPASDLFLALVDMNKVEEAKALLDVSICVCKRANCCMYSKVSLIDFVLIIIQISVDLAVIMS